MKCQLLVFPDASDILVLDVESSRVVLRCVLPRQDGADGFLIQIDGETSDVDLALVRKKSSRNPKSAKLESIDS